MAGRRSNQNRMHKYYLTDGLLIYQTRWMTTRKAEQENERAWRETSGYFEWLTKPEMNRQGIEAKEVM